MNRRRILEENRRSVNLPILKWLHLHSNPFLVGLRRVPSLEDLGRSSIIEENTEQCVFKFLRFRVMTFIENVSLNEPQPLRLVFTRCGSSRAAFRALPQKKNCMSYTPDFLDSNLRKHGKLITKTQKKSVTSNNWAEARFNGHRHWNWI